MVLKLDRITMKTREIINNTHGSCYDPKKQIIVAEIGKLSSYKLDNLLTFDDMSVLLKWNQQSNNGSIQGFGHFKFCGQGNFRYHIYLQDDSIIGLKSHSSEPIEWSNILAVYPQLEGGHGMLLWNEIERKLLLRSKLMLGRPKWYTFWDEKKDRGNTWSFFKCRKSVSTYLDLPRISNGYPKKDSKLILSNFEGVTNKEGSFVLRVLSFHLDMVSFMRLVLNEQILVDLNRFIPLKDFRLVVRVLDNVSEIVFVSCMYLSRGVVSVFYRKSYTSQ